MSTAVNSSVSSSSSSCESLSLCNGSPLTPSVVRSLLVNSFPGLPAIKSLTVSDRYAYLMSTAARVNIDYEGEEAGEPFPNSAFFKRMVPGELEHLRMKLKSSPNKLARDVKSYNVEVSFLSSKACQAFKRDAMEAGGPMTPDVYSAEVMPDEEDPINSKFSILMSDFASDKWDHRGQLRRSEILRVLGAIGTFHGYFWNGRVGELPAASAPAADLRRDVWDRGCYWSPDRQGDYLNDLEGIWERNEYWKWILTGSDGDSYAGKVRSMGSRLARCASEAARSTHRQNDEGQFMDDPHRTLIHGDLKAANLFLSPAGQVGVIDFQWLGWGLPSTDVMYAIVANVSFDSVIDVETYAEAEEEFLSAYWESLVASLVKFKAASSADEARAMYKMSDLRSQYELSFLDFCRTVFSYHWDRIKAIGSDGLKVITDNKDFKAKNAYNKDLAAARWLVRRCNDLLEKRGL